MIQRTVFMTIGVREGDQFMTLSVRPDYQTMTSCVRPVDPYTMSDTRGNI